MNHARAVLLEGLPKERILKRYLAADGKEIATGKFASPESSSALVANAFGYFVGAEGMLPPIPGCGTVGWPATKVLLEEVLRFPWSGGTHPNLDVVIETATALIAVESKRFEPFRGSKPAEFSDAYLRPVWGERMTAFARMRDRLMDDPSTFRHLDACQLVKHAFGLRTQAHRQENQGKSAVLVYLFSEPAAFPGAGGRLIPDAEKAMHRTEVAEFAAAVAGDEVEFRSCTYRQLVDVWRGSEEDGVRSHAEALSKIYAI